MDEQQTEVLIVGGGVAGLSAALFLARAGVRPVLVERHASTAILPQARAFNPRSLEIYRAIGLEPEIRANVSFLADRPEMMGATSLAGAEHFRLDLLAQVRAPESVSPTDWAMIDQNELERILRRRAEQAGADLHFATELVDLAVEDARVTARLRHDGADRRVRARWLIAADGHHAGVRTQLGGPADGPGVLGVSVNCVFDADLSGVVGDRRFLLAFLDQPRPATTLVPIRADGRWWLSVPYRPEDGESPADFPPSRWVELIRAAVGDPRVEPTLVPPVAGGDRLVMDSRTGAWVARDFRAGPVLFVGDCAHVVPPSGSFGANTAIADAHNLAWKLAAVVHGHADESLVDTYHTERRPVAVTTMEQAMQRLHGRHSGAGDAVSIDDLSMIFGYRYDRADGSVVDPHDPTGAPGQRAPHAWIERAGQRMSTVDLFGGGFVLLVGPGGAPWKAAAEAIAARLSLPLDCYQVGVDMAVGDDTLSRAYGLTDEGASLVRPDGFVGWRSVGRADTAEALVEALAQILHRPVAAMSR